MLDEIGGMVQTYLRPLTKRGGVINAVVTNPTAKTLISKYPNAVANADTKSSRWAQSLLTRMNFVKRRKIPSKVKTPERAQKEIEFHFLHHIISMVAEYHTLPDLIVNIIRHLSNRFLLEMVSWKKKVTKDVTIEGSADKRCLTGSNGIASSCVFLPVHLTYSGKTSQGIPKVLFSDGYSLSRNSNHFSSSEKSLKYLHEIIIFYMKNQCLKSKLSDFFYTVYIYFGKRESSFC